MSLSTPPEDPGATSSPGTARRTSLAKTPSVGEQLGPSSGTGPATRRSTSGRGTSPSAQGARRSFVTGWAEWAAAVVRIQAAVEEREMADLSEPVNETSILHYEFNEWGTWGYCPECKMEVSLDEDGLLCKHAHRVVYDQTFECPGSRTRPGDQPAKEVPQ